MKIVFFGSSEFAVPSLRKLEASSHSVIVAVTQPDRPKGRHLHLISTPIKVVAEELQIPVKQPLNCNDEEFIESMSELKPDVFIVIAYGQILSDDLLSIPKNIAINLHASLLPKYRGAAPINWALINGEKETGVTVIKINAKLDQGDIISQKTLCLNYVDNALSVSHQLSHLGADLVFECVKNIKKGKVVFTPQPKTTDFFARKMKKNDGLICWDKDAQVIANLVRGLMPWPSAFTYFKGKLMKIFTVEVVEVCNVKKKPGQVLEIVKGEGFMVKCYKNALLVKAVQFEGAKRMDAYSFAIGHGIKKGVTFLNVCSY